jgi:hypothetical protein
MYDIKMNSSSYTVTEFLFTHQSINQSTYQSRNDIINFKNILVKHIFDNDRNII